MFKRVLSAFIFLILLISASFTVAFAEDNHNLGELKNCKSIYSYSGNSNAYFYGSADKTLISSRVIPNYTTRYVSVSGYIRAVCHDENYACALYDGSKRAYGVVRMNMNSGNCDYCEITDAQNASNSSFAVSGNEIDIIQNSRTNTFVKSYNFSGQYLCAYYPPQGVERLFVNGGNAYAKAFSGEIYRLSGGNMTKCADLDNYIGFGDAGEGYIFTSDNRLIPLVRGNAEYPRCDFAVKTSADTYILSGNTLYFSGGEYSVSSAKALCAVGSKAAVLKGDFNCEIIIPEVHKNVQTDKSGFRIADGMIAGIEPEITVSKLKERYPDIKKVFDGNHNEITSGKVRTGFFAQYGGSEYTIALKGDVNSSGTLNGADIDEIMCALAKCTELSGCVKMAADYDFDGKITTGDLVMIGNKIC